jgi:predicted secreted protein
LISKRAVATTVVAGSAILAPIASAMTIGLTKGDSGRTVYVEKGDVVTIKLPENGSTPYRWEFRTRPSSHVLRLVSSQYIPFPAPPGVVGRGGTRVYTFKAQHGGTTSLKLQLTYIAAPHTVGGRFSLQVRPG